MESWQVISLLFGGVIGYLAINSIQQGKQLAVMSKQLDTLQMQVSLFLKNEVDTLKEIARSVSA